MSSPDNNKALVRRFYEEIDKGNIGILDERRFRVVVDSNLREPQVGHGHPQQPPLYR